ncbi:hypothetical protein AB0K71_30875 [Streptomyces syringium]|uniref:hypothetical protein n=1 Tax=Streptomyces syringium TaxID=76729 RepID=UPI0034401E33
MRTRRHQAGCRLAARTGPSPEGHRALTGSAADLRSGCAGGLPRPGKTFQLGEASPEQDSAKTASVGAKYTVTPTEVQTGTKADMDSSGLEKDEKNGPQTPVHVWSTLTHKSGKAMKVGDMDGNLVLRTAQGQRTRALIVWMGVAKWPNCPTSDTDKQLSAGQSEKICTAFLIPEGQKPAAVELTQGYYKKPLAWPVNN